MNIETALRERLADRATAMPVPDDPWTPFQCREARHRRSRRVRTAVAAAVVAVLAALQSGVVPMPGWAPAIAIASSNDALVDSPVRGSLAGDTAWQEDLRRQIKDLEDPDAVWRVSDRSKIKFLYAGDVGDMRLALAYVPVRFGFVTDPQLVWCAGPAGARPEEMAPAGNVDAGEPAATYLVSADDRPGLALVVGPRGATASIRNGYEFGADGRVRFAPPVTGEPGSGVAQTILPPSPLVPGVQMAITRNAAPSTWAVVAAGPAPSRTTASTTR